MPTAGALYETFPPKQARHILARLEFHPTPKHASWLNQAEIEISSSSAAASRVRCPTPRPWSGA
jgi:hypothetical protein